MTSTSPADLVARHVGTQVSALQHGYLKRTPSSVRTLAKLRPAPLTGLPSPDLWEVLFQDLPDELRGHGDQPSRGENACLWALILYATHQQGRTSPMHASDTPFGVSVRRLALARSDDDTLQEGVLVRFQQAVTAEHNVARLHHLRAIVSLLRAEEIPTGYGRLARDLYRLQTKSGSSSTTLRWGRDLYRPLTKATTQTQE